MANKPKKMAKKKKPKANGNSQNLRPATKSPLANVPQQSFGHIEEPSKLTAADEDEFLDACHFEEAPEVVPYWISLGEGQDDENCSDIEELPQHVEFRRHGWSKAGSRKIFIGSSGAYYEGEMESGEMCGHGRLCFKDGSQFVDGFWSKNRLTSLNLCQLTFDGGRHTVVIIKQAKSYLLTINEEHFVARASANSSNFKSVDWSLTSVEVKSKFFKIFLIERTVEDTVQSNRDDLLSQFVEILTGVVSASSNPVHCATVLILLSKFSKQSSPQVVLSQIEESSVVPSNLREISGKLLMSDKLLMDRKLNVFKFKTSAQPKKLDLQSIIQEKYTTRASEHRAMLFEKSPSSLPNISAEIAALPPEKIFYVTVADVEVFDHLCGLTVDEPYLSFFGSLFTALLNKLRSVASHTPACDVIPLITPVYGFLFKSFHEIASEISLEAVDCSLKDMLRFKNGKWEGIAKDIKWPSQPSEPKLAHRHNKTLYFKSLESQYRFILELLKHFQPDQHSKDKRFSHELQVLNSSQDDNSWKNKLVTVFKNVTHFLGLSKSLQDLPDERLIWLYLIDHTVTIVIKNVTNALHLYNPMLQGFVAFVSQSQSDSYESFRVVSHNILKFVTLTVHYFSGEDVSKPDATILESQMAFITKAAADIASDPLACSFFRDLIDEFNRYWALRELLPMCEKPEGPAILFLQIETIFQKFISIVRISLTKEVSVTSVVSYFRALNDFLDDFKDLDFLNCWYVKGDATTEAYIVTKVTNKLTGSNCSYRVTNIPKFVEKFDSLPPHYIMQVVERLLDLVHVCLEKNWSSGKSLALDQLLCSGMLLDAMRSSFLYLKEQPDYVDFSCFLNESTQPFERVVSNCATLSEFKKRVGIVKESFWYIRKMDEIGIDQALQLLEKINGLPSTDKLKQCYALYLSKYNFYIQEASRIDNKNAVDFVIGHLKSESCDKEIKLKEWDDSFKTEKIPVILAVLSAAWSLMVSKDVSGTGKFLKPHCIQILCVLRLLSIEKEKDTDNHLAQVLTGQGKSVILGLLSATLALTGHGVRILCYSNYLSSRDESDFEEFFRAFKVVEKIKYGTFEDMANEFLNPEIDGLKKSLRELVEKRVKTRSWPALGSITSETDNTVLLIDEVDVFFTKEFYGSTYASCTTMSLPGLAEIQEKIWNMVTTSSYKPDELLKYILDCVSEVKSGNMPFREFNIFRHKPGIFPLLIVDSGVIVKQYTNLSLTDEHLKMMINNAFKVANGSEKDSFINSYILNDSGRVCRRKSNGIYSPHTFLEYYNVFNYFRLKKSNFNHQSHANYGYLILDTGRISYARLPGKYPLILGVSGTLSDLYEHEKRGIAAYKINTQSVLPSFFGESNLIFNPQTNFTWVKSELDWCSKIFSRASAVVDAQRAVLIFFYSERDLNCFKRDNAKKFNRLNTLTENTQGMSRNLCINEAGISCTVTLSTRMMGRGVDYKSSVAVEKNGGVHVIQTFYSIDVKEETQIKGRTARKDNKGSYELILCEEHLKRGGVLDENDSTEHTYTSLSGIRTQKMSEEGKRVEKSIETAENDHMETMKYYFGSS